MSRENYTNKIFRRKRSCDFDARPRVRVYYTTLTSKIFFEKEVDFVCLRYAKRRENAFRDKTNSGQLLALQQLNEG